MGTAHTLDTRLNVFAAFAPKIPTSFLQAPFLFLANIDPELQLQVLQTMHKPKFILLDTMNYWIETKREKLLEVIARVNMVVVNDAEARQLSGVSNLIQAARWIQSEARGAWPLKRGTWRLVVLGWKRIDILQAFPLADPDPAGAAMLLPAA